jgi:hypothetical protein
MLHPGRLTSPPAPAARDVGEGGCNEPNKQDKSVNYRLNTRIYSFSQSTEPDAGWQETPAAWSHACVPTGGGHSHPAWCWCQVLVLLANIWCIDTVLSLTLGAGLIARRVTLGQSKRMYLLAQVAPAAQLHRRAGMRRGSVYTAPETQDHRTLRSSTA